MTAVRSSAPVSGHGLVLPKDPSDKTRTLARVYAGFLTSRCQRFFKIEPELATELRPVYHHTATLARQALVHNKQQLLRCFAAPTVGTPLQCMELRNDLAQFQDRIDAATHHMLPHLLLEMAIRKLIPQGQSVLWELGAPRLASMAIGGELVPPVDAIGWRFSASHIAAVGGNVDLARIPVDPEAMHRALADASSGFRFARQYWRTGRITNLATVDHNPIAAFEAHPDKAGNHIDLGGHSAAEWVDLLDSCFALIEQFMPGEFAEMGAMLHQMVPVGFDLQKHLSASYREAVGTVYLTLHPSLMIMTEAVIHEFQHNKFNVSSYSTEYISNAFHPLYKSPIRPDPRPLWGIMLAVHAFLPVAELYRRMRDAGHPLAEHADFERRMSEIDLKNHEGMEMLRANAQLTNAGHAMFEELEEMESRHLADRVGRGLENTPTEIHLA